MTQNDISSSIPAYRWTRAAVVSGLLAVLFYLLSVVVKPLPWTAGRILFFLFGPLTVVSAICFYRAIRPTLPSIALLLGAAFSAIGGVVVNLMAVVQDVQFTHIGEQIRQTPDAAKKELLETILWSVNVVQSGLDVSWDIFATLGAIFLAIALSGHPYWGRTWGVAGVAVAAAALVLNLATFPTSPAAAGLIDLGPGVALWYVLVLVQLARHQWRFSE